MAVQRDSIDFISCLVGHETYGVNTAYISSVQHPRQLRLVSSEGPKIGWLSDDDGDGDASVADDGVPVFDLAYLFGRSSISPNTTQRVIVLKGTAKPAAFLVDDISSVTQASADQLQPLPKSVINPNAAYFQGVITINETLMLLLQSDFMSFTSASTPEAEVANTAQAKRPTYIAPQPAESEWMPDFFHQRLSDTPLEAVTSRFNLSKEDVQPETLLPPQRHNTANKPSQILLFSPASQCPDERTLIFGLSATQVSEVLKMPTIIRVPAAPPWVIGLALWRNRVVPVIDLHLRLGLAINTSLPSVESAQLMIAQGADPEATIGFTIQPNLRTLNLPVPNHPYTRMTSFNPQSVRGVFELTDRTLIIPDLKTIAALEVVQQSSV